MSKIRCFLAVLLLLTSSFGSAGQSVYLSSQQNDAIERYRQEALATRNQWVRGGTSYRQSILTDKVSSKQTSTTEVTGNISVFVSSSLPKASMLALIQDAHQIHATVAIRGLIRNSFKDTIAYVTSLMKEAPECNIQINPPMFSQYQITQVPTVVVLSQTGARFDKLSGNLALLDTLREIRNRGSVQESSLIDAISRLEKIHV